ncbi:MAG: hypothetical protein ACUZ8E_01820 [Candidatus Anammoxibacter sp.]
MTNLKIQLTRLKRHYQASIDHYDPISFLDLAHTLRVWTELINEVEHVHKDPTFKKSILTKSVKEILRGSEYVYAFFPDGITTSAAATGETGGRILFHGPSKEKFSFGGLVRRENNGDVTIAQFILICRSLNREEINILNEVSKKALIEKVDFSKYMASPGINFNFSGHEPRHISNKDLIKRIANEYEASHAKLSDTNYDLNNVFSEPVKKLMKYGCAKLPLPYFVLLHIANNIIENIEGHFN